MPIQEEKRSKSLPNEDEDIVVVNIDVNNKVDRVVVPKGTAEEENKLAVE